MSRFWSVGSFAKSIRASDARIFLCRAASAGGSVGFLWNGHGADTRTSASSD